MGDFIEVHDYISNILMLVPKKRIKCIWSDEYGTFICTSLKSSRKKSIEWGYYVRESYEHIRAMLLDE